MLFGFRLLLAGVSLLVGDLAADQEGFSRQEQVFQTRGEGLYSGAYPIENQWDEGAEEEFSRWVEAIGLARERRVFRLARGLRDPRVNPLYSGEEDSYRFEADCATFAYALRAYFAYKTRRPFSFVANKGRRYRYGNRPEVFKDFSQFASFRSLFNSALGAVSSGHFRMDARLEGTDTYPIDVTPESVRPGVVYYDPSGHVLVVYRVDRLTGDVYMMDGHPDGTLTLKQFSSKIRRGSVRSGGGFRAWRQYDIEVLDEDTGSFRLSRRLNRDSPHHSASAQFQREYTSGDLSLTYHEWVKARLSQDGVLVDPEIGLRRRLGRLCGQIQARARLVDLAAATGLPEEPHPGKPRRVFWGEEEFHRLTTSVLDTRLRADFEELRRFMMSALAWADGGNPRLAFDGSPWELRTTFGRVIREYDSRPECSVNYRNSAGLEVSLSLSEVMRRRTRLSFDPYHCPELRWGASMTEDSVIEPTEFSTCPADRVKLTWYRKERQVRRRTRMLMRPLNVNLPRNHGRLEAQLEQLFAY